MTISTMTVIIMTEVLLKSSCKRKLSSNTKIRVPLVNKDSGLPKEFLEMTVVFQF